MQVGHELAGRYVLVELLGQGGMGEVWRGADRLLDRPVAVKVLRDSYTDPEFDRRLQREAKIAARVQHPGITVVHDIGSDDGQLFIVMELLRGRDLASVLLDAPDGLPVDTACSLAIQAAEALAAAHERNVIHRDLKPANLFVLPDGKLKVCDFGIAYATDTSSQLTAPGTTLGTPAYMPPEQWEGSRGDERSDIYSLGCVIYSLLLGHPPFVADRPHALMHHHFNTTPSSVRILRPDIPEELDALVLGMLAKNPASRPPTATNVAVSLKALLYSPTIVVDQTANTPENVSGLPPTETIQSATLSESQSPGEVQAPLDAILWNARPAGCRDEFPMHPVGGQSEEVLVRENKGRLYYDPAGIPISELRSPSSGGLQDGEVIFGDPDELLTDDDYQYPELS
jgi:serine/threonine protein kinase